jgi:hypothetical protein
MWWCCSEAHEEVLKGRLKDRGNFDDTSDAVLRVGYQFKHTLLYIMIWLIT